MDYSFLENEIRCALEEAVHIDDETERYRIFMWLQNIPEDIRTYGKRKILHYLIHDLPKEGCVVCGILRSLGESVKEMNDEEFEEFYTNYLDILERQQRIISEKNKIATFQAKIFLKKCLS